MQVHAVGAESKGNSNIGNYALSRRAWLPAATVQELLNLSTTIDDRVVYEDATPLVPRTHGTEKTTARSSTIFFFAASESLLQ